MGENNNVASKEQIDALDTMNTIRVEISHLMGKVHNINKDNNKTREKSIIYSKLEEAFLYTNQDIKDNHKL